MRFKQAKAAKLLHSPRGRAYDSPMTNRRHPFWLPVLLTACFVAAASGCSRSSTPSAPPGVPTRLTLAAGSAYRVTVDERGREVRSGLELLRSTNQVLTVAVAGVDPDGAMTLRATFGEARSELTLGAAAGPHATMAQTLLDAVTQAERAVAGLSITIRLSAEGGVLSVEGGEALRTAVGQSLGTAGVLNDPRVRDALDNLFSDDGLRERFGMLFPPLPTEPIDVGESWVRDGELSRQTPAYRFSTRYTARERSGDHILIDIAQNIGPNPVPIPSRADNGTIRQDLSGSGSGFASIDEASGLATQSEFRFEAEGIEWVDSNVPGRNDTHAVRHEQSLRIMIEPLSGQ